MPFANTTSRSTFSPSASRSDISFAGSRPKYEKTSPMLTSRSATAVSCFEILASAAARFVVRKVFPTPPLEANTEMIEPRCLVVAAFCPLAVLTFSAHRMARSTASRSSSLPRVRSTTSRIPARMAAGSSPFQDLSRTTTTAVIGATRPTNSARPSASGSLTSGDTTRTWAE